MSELKGKVAIVTGAGRRRGIGRSAALALARKGCDVVVTGTGRDPSTFPADEQAAGWNDVETVAAEIGELGCRALPLVVDVSNADQVRSMVGQTVDSFGRVDILVNNAAVARGTDRVPIIDLAEPELRRVLDVKFVGSFLCAQAVARVLVKQNLGGRIINMSSVSAKVGPANAMAYAAANSAVHALTRSLARELGPKGITVNAVCPGLIDTARNDEFKTTDGWDNLVRRIPLRRPSRSDEVGDFIAFLCTDKADYIHGQCINFDGGLVMEH